MKATLLIAVALTTVALCSAADPECKYRKIRKLPLHWANPTDCTRYFRCTNRNVMREVICAEGKAYNSKTGRCSTNKEGLCKLTLFAPLIEALNPCADEVSGVYLAQTGYCRNFYICNDNKAYPQACDAGSLFNATSGNCIPDTDNECWQNKCINKTDGTYLPDASSCSSFYVCANGEATAQNCGSGSYFNTSRNICEPDVTGKYCWENLCFQKSDGELLKDIYDCYNYYVCVSGTPIKQYCPDGSYFNSLENACVPGVCPTESPTDVTTDTTTAISTTETTTACTEVSTESTTACAEVTTESTTACAEVTTETTTACAEVTTESTTACVEVTTETTTACAEVTTETTTACVEVATETTTACAEVTTETTTACAEVTTETTTACVEESSCSGGYKQGELVPFPNYPENCDKYYVCTDGRLQERECGKGNRFDSTLGVCVPDTDNTCWTTECPSVTTDTTTACYEETTISSTDCSELSTITESTTAVAEADCSCAGGYKNGELVPFPNYPENCDKYYECSDGKLLEKECGKGNRFDCSLSVCVPDTENICSPTECNDQTDNTIKYRNRRSVNTNTWNGSNCLGVYGEGEVIRHPKDCRKYLTCVRGEMVSKDCDFGEYFELNTLQCSEDTQKICGSNGQYNLGPDFSHAKSVDLSNCTCPGGYVEGQLLAVPNYPENCDKYYICIDGRLKERECGAGNRFDTKLAVCVPDTDKMCKRTESTECPEVTTPSTAPDCTCPGGYKEGELLPFPNSPENCDKFYICTDGRLEEHECGVGNRFDSNRGVCVPDTDNICTPTESTECPEVTTPSPAMDCTCPGGYKEGELVPFPNYPENCDKFYICTDGRLEERECGVGNRFDSNRGVCVPDTDNICTPTESTECPEVTTPSPATDCTCPGGYKEGELVPFSNYPENCDKYYICSDGKLQERECGKGNRFNSNLGVCVPDTNNICWPTESTECPEVTTPSTAPDCTCPGGYKDGELLPFPNYPENCDKYYICTNGRLEERECGVGNSFDSNIGVCVPDTNNVCWPNVCKGQPDGATVADSTNCTSFYLCEGGKGEIFECPAEKWFDPIYQVCMPDFNATCINPCKDTTGIIFLPNPDCSKYFLCNDGQPFVETCPSGGFDVNLGKCHEDAICESTLCVGKEDGTTFAVVGNDTMFYLCLGGVAQIDECADGHVYNAVVGVCLEQPSSNCDQSKCNSTTPEDGAFAPLTNTDDTAFCLCRNGAAFLHHCTDNYTFRADLGICYSNAPCDPEICDVYPENTRSQNRNDTHSFCLCVSKEQVIVECPNNQTYNPASRLCQVQDDKCSSTFCFTAPEYTIFPALNNDTNGFCMCLNSGSVYKSCESGTKFDTDKNICLPNTTDVCSNSLCTGNSGLIFGAAGDPHSFCYCTSDGIAIKRSCPNSEIFNDALMICQAVGCDGQVCLTNPSEPFPADNEPYSFCICSSTDPSSVTKHNCQNGTRFDPYYLICKVDPCEKSICSDLSNDGMAFPANNNPQDFCVCNNGIPVLHTCPINSLFNSTTGICASATNLECDLSACANASSENTYPVAAKNDSHGFCYCFSTIEVEFFSCPGDALFNPIRGICDVSLPENPTTPADDCTCPGGYHQGQLLPNPTNCRLYYVCSHGQLQEFDCGTGNFFDKVTLTCQPLGRSLEYTNKQLMRAETIPEDDIFCVENEKHSVPSNCSQYEICIDSIWIRLSCPNAWYYNSEQRKCMEPRDDTICSYARVKNLPVCTASIEQRTLPGKESNCAQYFRCSHGKWRLKTCPKQHYYSKRFNTCILSPYSDMCAARNGTEINTDLLHNANGPSSKCQHMAVRPYEENCGMYIMCLEGRWWYHYCSLGMYFNRTYNYCMPNTDGQCVIASKIPIENHSMQPCDLQGSVRASLLACNRYYECRSGYWELRSCDPQQYFNATEMMCLPDADGVCEKINSINCTDGERREFPLNCKAYEICVRGEWQRASCNPTWTFDNILHMCVPNDGSCADNGLRQVCKMGDIQAHPLTDNCTQFYYCLDESWKVGTCLKGQTYAKELGECVPHVENDKCRPMLVKKEILSTMGPDLSMQKENATNRSILCLGRKDGSAVPHPNSCLHFFVCLSEEAIMEEKCIKGSYFDAGLGYCRPNDGKCVVPLEGVCANATDGEYVPHPDDCRAYYHCSTLNGTELLNCAEGDYFHNSTQECRIDNGECRSKVKETGKCIGTLEHGKRLPHEHYCNIYYACVRGLAILAECPAKHQFNTAVGHCVFNAMPECEYGGLSADINNATRIYSCRNITDGTHLPVITDCTKYLICSAGLELIKHCPSGTFFDADQRLCLSDDGSCPYVMKNISTQQPTSPDPNVCEGKHGSMMPNLNNCNEFYVCINGKLHQELCYVNHFFNSSKNQCQPYNFVENIGNVTATALEKRNETKIILNAQCNDKPTNYSQLCGRMPEGILIAEQGDCRRYINCNEIGEPISQRCRNGESFDSLLGFCRQNDGTCLLENGQRVGECNGRHGQLVRDGNNCRGYFVCINGQKISRECGEHEFFDKNLAECQEDVNNVCGANTQQSTKLQAVSCIGLNNSTLYPYTLDNCRSYFQCIDGSAIVHECADGLYFNASLTRCVKDISECVMPIITLKRAPELANLRICENAMPGQRYANISDNCRSFYICEKDGNIKSTNCPSGEIYNSKSDACEISENVVC